MKDKIIELIKQYRALSESLWSVKGGYTSDYAHGQASMADDVADDLEELIESDEKVAL